MKGSRKVALAAGGAHQGLSNNLHQEERSSIGDSAQGRGVSIGASTGDSSHRYRVDNAGKGSDSADNSSKGEGSQRNGSWRKRNKPSFSNGGNSVAPVVNKDALSLAEWKKNNEKEEDQPVEKAVLPGQDESNHQQSVAQHGILNPRSLFMRRWDMMVASLLVFVAVVTPFDVAFLDPSVDGLFFINRLVDICFFFDMGMQFSLAYYDDKTNTWIYDRAKIVRRYLMGWFIIDICSVFPFDALGLAVGDDSVSNLKGLRIVRLLRLAKLLRILRAGRIFKRLEVTFNIDYTNMEIGKFAGMTVMFAHWMACGWRMIVDLEGSDDRANWFDLAFPDTDLPLVNESTGQLFFASMYFSVSHMTIGYGSVVPVTRWERAFSMCCMLFGAFVFGYIIGSVASVIAARDVKRNRYYHMMKELNSFMSEGKFPLTLQSKLREYFRYVNTADSVSNYTHLLRFMSPKLRGEVARLMDNNWIDKVAIFMNTPNSFKIQVALALEQMTYPPAEPIFEVGDQNDRMYLVKKGVVALGGAVFVAGMVFCEESLYREDLFHWNSAHTMAFSVIFSLKRDVVVDIVKAYPQVMQRFRRLSVRRVFREEIWAYCNAHRRHHGHPPIKKRTNSWGLGGQVDAREQHYLTRLKYVMPLDLKEGEEMAEQATKIQRIFRRYMRKKWAEANEGEKESEEAVQARAIARLEEAVAEGRAEVRSLQGEVSRLVAIMEGQVRAGRGGAGGAGGYGAEPRTPPLELIPRDDPFPPPEGRPPSAAAAAAAAADKTAEAGTHRSAALSTARAQTPDSVGPSVA